MVCQCQLHHVDGLDHSEVRRLFQLKENEDERVFKLVGYSGFTWGVVSDFALNCFVNKLHCLFGNHKLFSTGI